MEDEIQREVLDVERRWTQAILENRAEEIARFITDDWVIVGPGGDIIDRARFLRAIESGELTHRRMESDEWRIRTYGDAIVATARVTSGGKYKGNAFRADERSTSVYIKHEGLWKCVLTQVTPIASR